MDDPDTRPEQYMPTESASEHAEHDRDAFPSGEGTSNAPGGGARSGAAGGAGEGTPGGPVGEEAGESTLGDPPATDRIAYDDHADDFPEPRRPAGRSGVSPSEAAADPGEPRRASQPGHEPGEPAHTPAVHPREEGGDRS